MSIVAVFFAGSITTAYAAAGRQTKSSAEVLGCVESDYDWWREAKFGVFIHWGPGATLYRHGGGREVPKGAPSGKLKSFNARNEPVPEDIYNGEYLKYRNTTKKVPAAIYDNLYRVFNPEKFDACLGENDSGCRGRVCGFYDKAWGWFQYVRQSTFGLRRDDFSL